MFNFERTFLTYIICFIISPTLFVYSQNSDLLIHSNSELRFCAFINGIIQNNNYDTILYIKNIDTKSIKLKIKYEKKDCSTTKQTLYLKPGNIYNYLIVPKSPQNKISVSIKNNFTIKLISCYPKIINIDTTVNQNINKTENNDNETVIITTTNTSGDFVTHYNLPNYSGEIGCPWPLTLIEFNNKYKLVANDTTDSGKLKTAKEIFSTSCIFVDEVKIVGLLIKDETYRLDFVKFAFKCTFDIENYYLLKDIFQSELTKNEFNSYLKNITYK